MIDEYCMLYDQAAFLDMSVSRSDRGSRSIEMQKGQKFKQKLSIKLQTQTEVVGFKFVNSDLTEYQVYVLLVPP